MRIPPRDPGTTVDATQLVAAADEAVIAEGVLPKGNDYYLGIVAKAVDQDLATVKSKYTEGDLGIVRARMAAKHLIYNRVFGTKPAETPTE